MDGLQQIAAERKAPLSGRGTGREVVTEIGVDGHLVVDGVVVGQNGRYAGNCAQDEDVGPLGVVGLAGDFLEKDGQAEEDLVGEGRSRKVGTLFRRGIRRFRRFRTCGIYGITESGLGRGDVDTVVFRQLEEGAARDDTGAVALQAGGVLVVGLAAGIARVELTDLVVDFSTRFPQLVGDSEAQVAPLRVVARDVDAAGGDAVGYDLKIAGVVRMRKGC